MTHPLDGVEAKINHAGKHLNSLRTKLKNFIKPGDPHEVTFRWVDGDKRNFTGHLHILRPIPLEFGVLVGDIAHDLRSALDHLIYQVARLSVAKPTGTQFPICSTKKAYLDLPPKAKVSLRDRFLDGIPDDHRAFVDGEQPYLAGADVGSHPLLWLNGLSNMDKHRIVAESFQRPLFVEIRTIVGSAHMQVFIDRQDTALVEGSRIFTAKIIEKSPGEVKIKVDMKSFPAFGNPPLGYDDLVTVRTHVIGIVKRFREALF